MRARPISVDRFLTIMGLVAPLLLGITATAEQPVSPSNPEIWQEPSSVVSRPAQAAEGWTETYIRGEAAKVIFENLGTQLEQQVYRSDGTAFLNRATAAIGCSYSDRFAGRQRYLCGIATKPDGATTYIVADPEMGGVARIGIGN